MLKAQEGGGANGDINQNLKNPYGLKWKTKKNKPKKSLDEFSHF